jgi:hypothetical protein
VSNAVRPLSSAAAQRSARDLAQPTDPRAAAKRAALRALKKARRTADKEGVELSSWEGEFWARWRSGCRPTAAPLLT